MKNKSDTFYRVDYDFYHLFFAKIVCARNRLPIVVFIIRSAADSAFHLIWRSEISQRHMAPIWNRIVSVGLTVRCDAMRFRLAEGLVKVPVTPNRFAI